MFPWSFGSGTYFFLIILFDYFIFGCAGIRFFFFLKFKEKIY